MATRDNWSRRHFIKSGCSSLISAAIGAEVVFSDRLPVNYRPIGLDTNWSQDPLPGKHSGLTLLNDRPINAETPAHLLADRLTPNDRFFVRNNGIPPQDVDSAEWTLTIEGESAIRRKVYTIAELKSKFETVSYDLTLECGGNGRSEFNPPAKGNQWSTGAVGCAKWTGVRLGDVLADVGVKSNAVYVGYYARDRHLSGDVDKIPISRGIPIAKAMEAESLIAWSMNDEDLPLLNGYPLRLVFGGWPASCSGKWIDRLVIRDRVHDGPKMGGQSYRIPCDPVPPGAKVVDDDMCIIEGMPVKSLITSPKTGAMIKSDNIMSIGGHAWCGTDRVSMVEYSIDFGTTWSRCQLSLPKNRHAWQQFSAEVTFPKAGYYEVWARATDASGRSQPMLVPGWNPKGYLNNACHRIAIRVS
ncbi:MAG: sulfite oxidase [Bacteroidota bacterium]